MPVLPASGCMSQTKAFGVELEPGKESHLHQVFRHVMGQTHVQSLEGWERQRGDL